VFSPRCGSLQFTSNINDFQFNPRTCANQPFWNNENHVLNKKRKALIWGQTIGQDCPSSHKIPSINIWTFILQWFCHTSVCSILTWLKVITQVENFNHLDKLEHKIQNRVPNSMKSVKSIYITRHTNTFLPKNKAPSILITKTRSVQVKNEHNSPPSPPSVR